MLDPVQTSCTHLDRPLLIRPQSGSLSFVVIRVRQQCRARLHRGSAEPSVAHPVQQVRHPPSREALPPQWMGAMEKPPRMHEIVDRGARQIAIRGHHTPNRCHLASLMARNQRPLPRQWPTNPLSPPFSSRRWTQRITAPHRQQATGVETLLGDQPAVGHGCHSAWVLGRTALGQRELPRRQAAVPPGHGAAHRSALQVRTHYPPMAKALSLECLLSTWEDHGVAGPRQLPAGRTPLRAASRRFKVKAQARKESSAPHTNLRRRPRPTSSSRECLLNHIIVKAAEGCNTRSAASVRTGSHAAF
mmetsp:Transcript_7832/g.18761  ORF Transcript_7832/g.18761 Transcript_7832/m.18761 type:complete len:303 (-) Transcript_7832:2559-3467(-)